MAPNSSATNTAVRIVVALALSIAWAGIVPYYSAPFEGCDTSGYLTLKLGCSNWPEVARGFGFVILLTTIGPRHRFFHLVALLLLACLSVVNQIKTGTLSTESSDGELFFVQKQSLQVLVGGLIAFALYFGFRETANRYLGKE